MYKFGDSIDQEKKLFENNQKKLIITLRFPELQMILFIPQMKENCIYIFYCNIYIVYIYT